MTNDSLAFSWLWDAIRRLLKAGNSLRSTLKNGWSIWRSPHACRLDPLVFNAGSNC
jgi:hypothetical protein